MTEGDTTRTHTPRATDATEFLARCRPDSETGPSGSEDASPAPVHALLHSRADGWALISRDHGPHFRWTSLAGRGAGPATAPRVAQAVAVRVLAEQGVVVQGWSEGQAPGTPATFRARPVATGRGRSSLRSTHR